MILRILLIALMPSLLLADAPSLLLTNDKPPEYRNPEPSKEYMDPARAFPHSDWMREAMPIGNGRLGAMIFGDPLKERIQFNEISLWTGGANESGKYSVDEPGGFGSYQNFGDLFIEMKGMDHYDNYRRELDLATGIHTTTWRSGGVTYKREVFCSKPDECIVVRITSDKPTDIKIAVDLKGAHGEKTSLSEGGFIRGNSSNNPKIEDKSQHSLSYYGQLNNGLAYAAMVYGIPVERGQMSTKQQTLEMEASSHTLILSASTDYAMNPDKKFRLNNCDGARQSLLLQVDHAWSESAGDMDYAKLRKRHIADFTALMGRVELDLGAPPEGLTLPERLKRYREGRGDPHLEMLLFQFGRYLMISSSRSSLPANLQGLWNDMNHPAWYCDYHTNINIQMNYWPVEVANLSECAMPLFNWIEASIPGSKAATQKAFGEDTPGWTMRTSVNIFGGNGWEWNLPASAWFALHYWEHYAFTGDKKFLQERAWPIFEEVSKFWLQKLIEKDGKLVVPDGWSPEHGPREDGPAHDQQIVWTLFTHTLDAAKVLELDNDFTKKVTAAREKLLGPQVGSWGQIMEWTKERPTLEKSQHRHTSHLFAVYPGNQITLNQTPELAKAAQISLAARGNAGDSRRSWTWGWRCALWARLGMPSQASDMIRGQLTWNSLPNLMATHPPFQFDGNAGITAGMCEMFVQSHEGEIFVMPAISTKSKWRSGSFNGLKARGGFVVGGSWKDRTVESATILSEQGKPVKLRLPNIKPLTILVTPSKGDADKIYRHPNGTYHFDTIPGERYDITWNVTEAKVDR